MHNGILFLFTLYVKPLMLFFGSLRFHERNQDSLVGVMADGGGREWFPWLQADSRQKHINLGLTGFIYCQWRGCVCWAVLQGGCCRRLQEMVLLSCHSGAQALSPNKVFIKTCMSFRMVLDGNTTMQMQFPKKIKTTYMPASKFCMYFFVCVCDCIKIP